MPSLGSHRQPLDGSASAPDAAPPLRVRPGLVARCPAAGAAACFIAGIVLHEHLPVLTGLWLLCAASLALASLAAPWGWAGNAALSLAMVALGLGAAQVARFQFAGNHVGLYVGDHPRLAWLDVELVESPRLLRTP